MCSVHSLSVRSADVSQFLQVFSIQVTLSVLSTVLTLANQTPSPLWSQKERLKGALQEPAAGNGLPESTYPTAAVGRWGWPADARDRVSLTVWTWLLSHLENALVKKNLQEAGNPKAQMHFTTPRLKNATVKYYHIRQWLAAVMHWM